jgi:lipopolysaccharide biosynthesis glycosyltransferase
MNYNTAELCKDCKMPVVKIDKRTLREMVLVVENDYQFYKSNIIPWAQNAARKMKRGNFNKNMFLGGLERNLAKRVQMRYYEIEKMGRPPVLSNAEKKYIAMEFLDKIIELAEDYNK